MCCPYLEKDSDILELGCNMGRSLNYLYKLGYNNLTGIEIGLRCEDLMKKNFSEMYKRSKIVIGDVTEEIKKFEDNEFELVFCHSVLVNIHPKYNHIFEEISRVSRKFILFLENEGSYQAYPRDFQKMFEKNNYKMISSKIFRGVCDSFPIPYRYDDIFSNNTIRLFVKDESFT